MFGKEYLFYKEDMEENKVFGNIEKVSAKQVFSLAEFMPTQSDKLKIFNFALKEKKLHLCYLLPNCNLPKNTFYYKGQIPYSINILLNLVLDSLRYDGPKVEIRY